MVGVSPSEASLIFRKHISVVDLDCGRRSHPEYDHKVCVMCEGEPCKTERYKVRTPASVSELQALEGRFVLVVLIVS